MPIEPICEVCHKKPATSFSFFGTPFHDSGIQGWKFVCGCAVDAEGYYISIKDYLKGNGRPWLEHLAEVLI